MPKVNDALRVNFRPGSQVLESCARIQVGASLRWVPLAVAVATVIEYELIHSQQVVGTGQLAHACAQVTSVAVEPQPGLSVVAIDIRLAWDEPGVQRQAVRRCEVNILVMQAL